MAEPRTHPPSRRGDFAWSLKGSSPANSLATSSYRSTVAQTAPERAVVSVFPIGASASDATRSPHLTPTAATPVPVMRAQRTEPVANQHPRGGGSVVVGGGGTAVRVSSRARNLIVGVHH